MKKSKDKEFDYLSVFKKYLELNKQIEDYKQSYENKKGNVTFAQIKSKEQEREELLWSIKDVRFIKRNTQTV